MTKLGSLKFVLLLFICGSPVFAQKVKYKDVFGLLSTKQYEEAEPFLKRFLKDNEEHANALLFMGIVYQEKSFKNDVLQQTSLALKNIDSAIYFYDQSYKLIDDKELKKNKEYYQAYNRRDLRTGEFGVKLSDVQFDIEKKKEVLRERADRIKMVKYHFSMSDSLYKKSYSLFKDLQSAYPDARSFYLMASDPLLKQLTALSQGYDSSMKFFEHYKASLQTLGKTGYDQKVISNEIKNFKEDGASISNFLLDEIQVWDYKKFADEAISTIKNEVIPMREHLVTYDEEISKLGLKVIKDSVSVKSDLTKLIDKLLLSQLKKFDPDPLPMTVLSFKIADLEYRSIQLENVQHKDTTDLLLRVSLLENEEACLNKMDSLTTKLSDTDIDQEAEVYEGYILKRYGGADSLKRWIKSVKEFTTAEHDLVASKLQEQRESLKWIMWQNDSIPLFNGAGRSPFHPLLIVDDKYTAGLSFADSLSVKGYFCSITPSRVPNVQARFAVDNSFVKRSEVASFKSQVVDSDGQIYFVVLYSEAPVKEKYPVTLAKIYRSDGLAWAENYQLSFLPVEVNYSADSAELTLKGNDQSLILDKNGKQKK